MSNPESGMFFFTHIMYSNANACLVFLIFKQEKVSVCYCRSCKFRTIIILQVMQINNEWNIYRRYSFKNPCGLSKCSDSLLTTLS